MGIFGIILEINKNKMNANFQEGDLFEKYRQSVSKRYKGNHRAIHLSVNKKVKESSSIDVQESIKEPNKSVCPSIELAKNIFQSSNMNSSGIPSCIVIRSTNPQINFKDITPQLQKNKRTLMKSKFLKHSSVHSQDYKDKDPIKSQNTERILQNAVDQFLDKKFKFKKRFMKDSLKFGIPQDNESLLRNQLIMRLQPFSPIVLGEKKNTHVPQSRNKKSKTEYENGIKQEYSNRQQLNFTQSQNKKDTQSELFKRGNSFLSRKAGTQTVIQPFSSSYNAPKFIKQLTSNVQSKEYFHRNPHEKFSLPKINCVNKQSLKSTDGSNEGEKNKQKYKKPPILIRHQFDVKNVDSESFIVVQAESQSIVYGNRFNTPYQIASLTKIMTFYVVLRLIEEHKINIKEEKIEIQYKCSSIGGTSADLYQGEIYTLQSLLYGLMLPSGNDAALSLAVWGGKFTSANPQDLNACISNFVSLMNKQAKMLNLIETRFGNPHGLPHKYGRSTAFDIAKLCMQCMKNEFFKKVVGTKIYKCVVSTKQNRKRLNVWQNTNKLLRRQGFIGIKTGITITAGPCLASAYRFESKTYICVVLRAKKISRRFKQTRKILHWCLQKLYKDSLSPDSVQQLKSLKKNNAQIDSDYSQDESIFRYDVNNSKQYRKRCDIISQM